MSESAGDPSWLSIDQIVLILVGLVGSGKSTFAEALEHHYPQFRRCNQDELGDRRRVENLARKSLREGLSICVDRTNFDEQQRAHWIRIADEFPGTKVWVIVFDTPYEVCAARLRERTNHPTITDPTQGLSILARFSSSYVPPSPHEGYDRLLTLPPPPPPTYTAQDVLSILQSLHDAPPPDQAGHSFRPFRQQQLPRQFFRGGGPPRRAGDGGYGSANWRSSYRPVNSTNNYDPPRGRGAVLPQTDRGGSWRRPTAHVQGPSHSEVLDLTDESPQRIQQPSHAELNVRGHGSAQDPCVLSRLKISWPSPE